MATADDFATIADLRSYLRLATNDDDPQIDGHRASALEHIEKTTGRNLLDRLVTGEAGGRTQDDLTFFVADVSSVSTYTINYRRADAGPGFGRTSNVQVPADRVRILEDRVTFRPDDNGWPEKDPKTWFACEFETGIPDDSIPEAFKEALRLIVRELYEGTMLDDPSVNGIVAQFLGPFSNTRTAGPAVYAAAAVKR